MSARIFLKRCVSNVVSRTLHDMPGEIKVSAPARKENYMDQDLLQSTLQMKIRSPELEEMAMYYFDGGKFLRPKLTITMAGAINAHLEKANDEKLWEKQKKIAMVAEMFHLSSLVHDDVIDHSEKRRGKDSINQRWGQKKSIMAGDYVMARSMLLLTQTGSTKVVEIMGETLANLVNGEIQQMKSKQEDHERFELYLEKTYNKTGSLIAKSCKSVAVLACDDQEDHPLVNTAFNFGRNLGIAFQLADDLLDFEASADQIGKPAAADLNLGLATAPVLFASKEFPQLNELILRKFSEPGDVQEAFEIVLQSKGLEQARKLARTYAANAVKDIEDLKDSQYKDDLHDLAQFSVQRCN